MNDNAAVMPSFTGVTSKYIKKLQRYSITESCIVIQLCGAPLLSAHFTLPQVFVLKSS